MICPTCAVRMVVYATEAIEDQVDRRRECPQCGLRYATEEHPTTTLLPRQRDKRKYRWNDIAVGETFAVRDPRRTLKNSIHDSARKAGVEVKTRLDGDTRWVTRIV